MPLRQPRHRNRAWPLPHRHAPRELRLACRVCITDANRAFLGNLIPRRAGNRLRHADGDVAAPLRRYIPRTLHRGSSRRGRGSGRGRARVARVGLRSDEHEGWANRRRNRRARCGMRTATPSPANTASRSTWSSRRHGAVPGAALAPPRRQPLGPARQALSSSVTPRSQNRGCAARCQP